MSQFTNKKNASSKSGSNSFKKSGGKNFAPNYLRNTKMCKIWLEKGYCPHGDKCRYAHGKQENYRGKVDFLYAKARRELNSKSSSPSRKKSENKVSKPSAKKTLQIYKFNYDFNGDSKTKEFFYNSKGKISEISVEALGLNTDLWKEKMKTLKDHEKFIADPKKYLLKIIAYRKAHEKLRDKKYPNTICKYGTNCAWYKCDKKCCLKGHIDKESTTVEDESDQEIVLEELESESESTKDVKCSDDDKDKKIEELQRQLAALMKETE